MNTKINKNKIPIYSLLSLIPAFFVITTLIGTWKNFSPVPDQDMWITYVKFFLDFHTHPFDALWIQYEEHRIVLTKILFLIDIQFFGGQLVFLIVVNVLLMGAIWATLTSMAKEMLGSHKNLVYLCSMVSAIFAFSWLQKENIIWANQSQFFLAYLLPLFALSLLARWIKNPGNTLFLYSATICGVFSTLTMANGLITPFLLVALAFGGRRKWDRYATMLLAIAALTATAWLFHCTLESESHQHAPLVARAQFVLFFLGAPGTLLFKSSQLTLAFGLIFVSGSIVFLWIWMRGKIDDPMFLACLVFLVYVVASAVAAAWGRTYHSDEGAAGPALLSRYETTVLTGYACMVLMLAYYFRDRALTVGTVATFLVAAFVMMFQSQLQALEPVASVWQKEQAALVLDLGINDIGVIRALGPQANPDDIQFARRLAHVATERNLSVFGNEKYRLARLAMGKRPEEFDAMSCLQSAIDVTSVVQTDRAWTNVQGWAINSSTGKPPELAFLVKDGTITGAAFIGLMRQDVAKSIGPAGLRAGYQGYFETPVDKSRITLACLG